jgi:hypothetical protein
MARYASCNDSQTNQNQHRDSGSENDSVFFGEDELTDK